MLLSQMSMGSAVRDHVRTKRKPTPARKQRLKDDPSSIPSADFESPLRPSNGPSNAYEPAENTNPNPNFDSNGWGQYTEEQLEEILLKNLDFLYREALTKLVALGYEEEVALKAILNKGHCGGTSDALVNILQNSLHWLTGGCGSNNGGDSKENKVEFTDLSELQQYSLAVMVFLLQEFKPHLSRRDAMWHLLMCDLHLGRASIMDIEDLPSCDNYGSGVSAPNNEEGGNVGLVEVLEDLCRRHGGICFGEGETPEFPVDGLLLSASQTSLQREIECPKRFKLTPEMKSVLKRNVAMFVAGFRASSKQCQMKSLACPSPLTNGDPRAGTRTPNDQNDELPKLKNQDAVNAVLQSFRDLNIDENGVYVPKDRKDEVIFSLVRQIEDLEVQVKERKEWALQKAMQAARKLSNDLTELNMLRMETDETPALKKGSQTIEDSTIKRLSEMENDLRSVSGQLDRANAAIRRLETENAETRAEMEASKLSASETANNCLKVAKRERKYLKKLSAWEKQKAKLQEEIAAEKQKISGLQQQLVQIEAAQKEAEVKWRQEQKAKELALAQVEEERRLKEQTEASNKRKLEALRLKIEVDFQRHKDDVQRLEQELSRLKVSAQSTEPHHQAPVLSNGNPRGEYPNAEAISELLDESQDSSGRECLICMRDEVCVVFLPCAHQVVCANCNAEYGKKGKETCPCCLATIEQRIRVFGPSS